MLESIGFIKRFIFKKMVMNIKTQNDNMLKNILYKYTELHEYIFFKNP